MIRYLVHSKIDKSKWDACIDGSGLGLIYGFSWYLDRIAPGWDALILGEYEAVMPVTYRSKLGIKYIFTPLYAQQLGVFGRDLNEDLTLEFLKALPAEFRIIDLKMNERNLIPASFPGWQKKTNYILDISRGYDEVRSRYNRNCHRNIKKAAESGLKPGKTISADEFASYIGNNLLGRMSELKQGHIELLREITDECLNRGMAEIACIRNENDGVDAAGSFLYLHDRVIFSVCASSGEGKEKQAMYMLVDEQIKKNAGACRIFDFSGSEIKGIAYFNSTFGAEPVGYPFVHINHLNLLQRILSGKIK